MITKDAILRLRTAALDHTLPYRERARAMCRLVDLQKAQLKAYKVNVEDKGFQASFLAADTGVSPEGAMMAAMAEAQ